MKTEQTRGHPSRSQLIQHIKSGGRKIARHLETCEECHTMVAALRALTVVDKAQKRHQNVEPLVQRLLSLPSLVTGPTGTPVYAKCVSDSWQRGMPTAAREATHGIERRARFHAVDLTIDLVVDRLGDRWECAMRVSRRGKPVTCFVATLGSRKMLPVDTGFFSWLSHQPPHSIRLWSSELNICLEAMSW